MLVFHFAVYYVVEILYLQYLSTFENAPENYRLLLNILLYGAGLSQDQKYISDNPMVECAYFEDSKSLIVINNSEEAQSVSISTDSGPFEVKDLAPLATAIYKL